ncbi:hypothetical protein BDY19DRAFT_760088 [Irpex rosettiformis]|uniref:Uncharacterized protein n=1 Tax=Irpex rosettiformis TaxID=378272 RepID=A0ACB8U7I7_9APHY|nr:hypothetical protein BDY19DRAFT_760088 [Irpex rosettiformis]
MQIEENTAYCDSLRAREESSHIRVAHHMDSPILPVGEAEKPKLTHPLEDATENTNTVSTHNPTHNSITSAESHRHSRLVEKLNASQDSTLASPFAGGDTALALHGSISPEDSRTSPASISISLATWRELTSVLCKLHEILPGILPESTRSLCDCVLHHHSSVDPPATSSPPLPSSNSSQSTWKVNSSTPVVGTESNPIDLCDMDIDNMSSCSPGPAPPSSPTVIGFTRSIPDEPQCTFSTPDEVIVTEAYGATALTAIDAIEDVAGTAEPAQKLPAYNEQEYQRRRAEVLALKIRAWDARGKEARIQEEMKKKRKEVLAAKALAWKEKGTLALLKKQSSAEQERDFVWKREEVPTTTYPSLKANGEKATTAGQPANHSPPLSSSSSSQTEPPTSDVSRNFVRASTVDLFYADKIKLLYPPSTLSEAVTPPPTHFDQFDNFHPTSNMMEVDVIYRTAPRSDKSIKHETDSREPHPRSSDPSLMPPVKAVSQQGRACPETNPSSIDVNPRFCDRVGKTGTASPTHSRQQRMSSSSLKRDYQTYRVTEVAECDRSRVRLTMDTLTPLPKSRIARASQPTHCESSPPGPSIRQQACLISSTFAVPVSPAGDERPGQPVLLRKRSNPDSSLSPRSAYRPWHTSDDGSYSSPSHINPSPVYPYADTCSQGGSSSAEVYTSTASKLGCRSN